MGHHSTNPDHAQEANSEQLLQLLEAQVAAARARRTATDMSRGRTGTVGLFIIVGGAVIALSLLLLLLEQMRPPHAERRESASAAATR